MIGNDTNLEVSDEIYSNKLSIGKIFLCLIVALFLGFSLNFPLKETIKNQAAIALGSMKTCPISYESIDISFFLPKITLKKVTLPARCFGKKSKEVKLRSLPISLRGPSISPFGIRLHTKIKIPNTKTEINLYPALSLGEMSLKVEDTQIDSRFIRNILGNDYLTGVISIETLVKMQKNSVKEGDLNISSKNLVIPSQTVSGLRIPELKLNTLAIRASMRKSNLKVSELTLGDNTSPLFAKLKGTIRVNKYNFDRSKLDLEGRVKFSPEIIQAFPAINLLINGKESNNGFFKLKVNGTIALPKPKFL